MAKLPPPPAIAALRRTAPEHALLTKGTPLWRIFCRGGSHPTTWGTFRAFGPADARFDHHLPPARVQERAILYAALEPATCIAEVFQEDRKIEREADQRFLVGFRTERDLRLLDLTGPWPTRAGASMAIHTGPYARTRAWSRAIHEAFPDVQGLLCCSSMDANRHTVALYERAARALPSHPVLHRALSEPDLEPFLLEAARRFGYELA